MGRKQFIPCSDPIACTCHASGFLCGKLLNEKNMLLRAAQETPDPQSADRLRQAADTIAGMARMLTQDSSVDSFCGLEGAAAQAYFGCFDDMQAALEVVGLDSAYGFLYTLRPGRPALARDLMEELRAPLCDRFVLTLFNRGQLRTKNFSNGAEPFSISENARKMILFSWQARKRETIQHPFLKGKILIGVIPFAQAMLLARTLYGDLDDYPPFIWR